jgi:hypothetical protein
MAAPRLIRRDIAGVVMALPQWYVIFCYEDSGVVLHHEGIASEPLVAPDRLGVLAGPKP